MFSLMKLAQVHHKRLAGCNSYSRVMTKDFLRCVLAHAPDSDVESFQGPPWFSLLPDVRPL